MLARMKSQMGGEIPAEILDRMKNRPPEMMAECRKADGSSTVTQQIAYAVIQSMLDKDLQYRSSRLDDMGKSPLPDWLDIGIASYASGSNPNVSFLQQNMDQTFPDRGRTLHVPSICGFLISDQGGSGGGGGMIHGRMRSGGGRTAEVSAGEGRSGYAARAWRGTPQAVLAEEARRRFGGGPGGGAVAAEDSAER